MSTATKPVTAEEFARMPGLRKPCDLIRGEIVTMTPPTPRHGQICAKLVFYGLRFNEDHDCMHVLCNDSGVVTERNPDTVRGPDVWYISYDKLPQGPIPGRAYLDLVPDVAFEVISPWDRWGDISIKVNEYLAVGVSIVCVLDPELETIQLFFPDKTARTLSANDELTLPNVLPEFTVPVQRFFE